MTAHFPGLLQALHLLDRSYLWLATGTFPWLVIGTSYT